MDWELIIYYEYLWVNDQYSCETTINTIKNTRLSDKAKKALTKYAEKQEKEAGGFQCPLDMEWEPILWEAQKSVPTENIYFPDECTCKDKKCFNDSWYSDSDSD